MSPSIYNIMAVTKPHWAENMDSLLWTTAHRGSLVEFGDFCISLPGNHVLACTRLWGCKVGNIFAKIYSFMTRVCSRDSRDGNSREITDFPGKIPGNKKLTGFPGDFPGISREFPGIL